MEGARFDSITRALHSPSGRRSILGLVAGSTLGLLGLREGAVKGKKGKKVTF